MSERHSKPTQPDATLADLPDDDYYRVLSSERRRRALSILEGRTGPVDLTILATEIVDQEPGGPTPDEALRRVETTLHHVHLPMLSAAGIIDYDPATTRVESCPPQAAP